MCDELDKIKAPSSKDFKLESIINVNFDPHPYCITPEHLSSDRICLDEAAIKEAEEKGVRCGMYVRGNKYTNRPSYGYTRCDIPYDEHTSDKVLFIKALVDKPIKKLAGLQKYLMSIKPTLKKLKVDGIAFIKPD